MRFSKKDNALSDAMKSLEILNTISKPNEFIMHRNNIDETIQKLNAA
jgi:hypothetical protein